ncbi:MAG: MFS transporter [Paludisphaera borealis]|nr:MFS transporter [Paludisphaera borealis]MDR3619192.1 MFS transporter [Paludisphaera borealis]
MMSVENVQGLTTGGDIGGPMQSACGRSGRAESATAPSVPGPVVFLFAIAAGLSVANVYYAHPLLDALAREFRISDGSVGIVVTAAQSGYALGLLLLTPLGDLLNRRRLIVGQLLASVLALIAVAFAPNIGVLLAGMATVGFLAVVVQTLVAFAATLAASEERGRVVGSVTSGVVLGILLARVVAGFLVDLAGWRAVYLTSAIFTLIMAGALFRVLPDHERVGLSPSYPRLLRSVFVLFVEEPILRIRAGIAMLIFAAFSAFWTSLVLHLSAPPLSLSHTMTGMFGLAGVAGALAAGRAGRLADRGLANWTTGVGLTLLLASWLLIGLTQRSISALIVGVILLDLAIQAVHVTNQSLIFTVRPEARSRLVAGYMVFYSIGSGLGSISSTAAYSWAGWTGVCLLGAFYSALALAFWALTMRWAPGTSTSDSSSRPMLSACLEG